MSFSDFKLIRLTPEHELLPFNCDDKDLNEYIFEDAKANQSQLLAVTYLLESDQNTVAFFSIFNDKITVEDFESKSKWKRLVPHNKRKKSYPAVKLGRLGINIDHQRVGLGRDILNYIKILFIDKNKTGCKFITVDAYSKSLQFYEKNGFDYMTTKDKQEDTRLMFYDLSQLL
ncbi:MAG: acetyltransferase domain protein [Mucilaginibacter sp.]|nr:acetyltransferase domain protein [Mucilaginibacter sp.]